MGVCQSILPTPEYCEQYRKNREIEKELEKNSGYLEQKVLLLGPGESGKSTILKQLKFIHKIDVTPMHMAEKKYMVYLNIMQGINALFKIVEVSNIVIPLGLQEDVNEVKKIIKKYGLDVTEIDQDLKGHLKKLWYSAPFQSAWGSRIRYHLADNTKYFFENLDRICVEDYIPSPADMLQTRVPTSGVVSVDFVMKNIQFRVFDVGGQRSERKKWIHCFDNVQAVLYIAAVSEFNQKTLEDDETNRIEEALKLYHEILSSPYLRHASMILFLNKKDLLQEKLVDTNVVDFFPEYDGENTYEPVMEFFKKKFDKCVKDPSKKPYVHETCAVSDTVQIVINSVIDTVVQENLRDTGMI